MSIAALSTFSRETKTMAEDTQITSREAAFIMDSQPNDGTTWVLTIDTVTSVLRRDFDTEAQARFHADTGVASGEFSKPVTFTLERMALADQWEVPQEG